MSNQDNRYSLFFLIFIIFFASCNDENNFSKNFALYKSTSTSVIGALEYNKVIEQANDTFANWQKSHLPAFYANPNDAVFLIDSLFCFNKQKDKCISSLLGRALTNGSTMDGISFFYGVKIKEQWYFFTGAHIVIPRENYQSDTHVPLSFDKLHEIAMKEVFSGYLIKDAKGNWQINDKFFGDINRVLDIHKKEFKTESEWEDWWTKTMVEANWSKRDTTHYDKTK